MPDDGTGKEKWMERLRFVFAWLLATTCFVFTTIEMYLAIRYGVTADMMRRITESHFQAVFGQPTAAIASLLAVIVLRSTAGPIEFEVFQFKFHGASGPIVFWILCFLAFVTGLKVLW